MLERESFLSQLLKKLADTISIQEETGKSTAAAKRKVWC